VNLGVSGGVTFAQDVGNVILFGPETAFAQPPIGVAPVPQANFAQGVFLETPEDVANASRFLGGNAILILATLRPGGVARNAGGAGDDVVDLFRAVSEGEVRDIQLIRGFRPRPSPSGFPVSDPAKFFTASEADAARFGRMLFKLEGQPFTIVRVRVPRRLLTELEQMVLDRFPAVIVQPETLSLFNRSIAELEVLRQIPLVGVPGAP
jgi:hypothetical protein